MSPEGWVGRIIHGDETQKLELCWVVELVSLPSVGTIPKTVSEGEACSVYLLVGTDGAVGGERCCE